MKYNAISVSYSLQQSIYTDTDLHKQKQRCKIDSCITELLALLASQGLNLTGGIDIELVVLLLRNPKSSENPLICKYYFVDHPNRLLFWLHEQPGEKLFDGIRGVGKMSHISASSSRDRSSCIENYVMFTEYAVEQQYWQVCHFVGLLLLCTEFFSQSHHQNIHHQCKV